MPPAEMIVPAQERYEKLKEVMFEYVEQLTRIRKQYPNLLPEQSTGFLLLVYPWLADDLPLALEQRTILSEKKRFFASLGFDGAQVRVVS